MPFKNKQVDSSMFNEVGYDEETKELRVRFKNGREYVYEGVEDNVYNDLLEATSKGKFFGKNIKPNYKFHKGGGDE